VSIAATPEEVFAFIDDHSQFASHMSQSSWMMGGGRMLVDVDAARGQAVGSHIRLSGKVFGVRLFLDEVVTRRNPPTDKVWETVGIPRLLVIGSYRMGCRHQVGEPRRSPAGVHRLRPTHRMGILGGTAVRRRLRRMVRETNARRDFETLRHGRNRRSRIGHSLH
jgi:hypothetical protein